MGVQRLASIGWKYTESENVTLGKNGKKSERRIDDRMLEETKSQLNAFLFYG